MSVPALLVLLSLIASHARPVPDSTLGLDEVAFESEVNEIYLGSPSIVRVRSTGALLISADRFGAGSGTEGEQRNVSIYSSNASESWELQHWVPDQYWSSLFQLASASDSDVFLLGTSTDGPAPLKIARSRDGGLTWLPGDSAVLAGEIRGNLSFETGPTAVVEHGGRLYRAIERLAPPLFRWGVDYEAVVASAPVDCGNLCIDALTDPDAWTLSPPLRFNVSWLEGFDVPEGFAPGFLEGNMVLGPDGSILYNILRMNDVNNNLPNFWGNRAVLLEYKPPPTNSLSFVDIM